MKKDERFYFANLGADVARCVKAAKQGDDKRYEDSLSRARTTLSYLRSRPEAYEEGLLLLRALDMARRENSLAAFSAHMTALMMPVIPAVLQ